MDHDEHKEQARFALWMMIFMAFVLGAGAMGAAYQLTEAYMEECARAAER